MRHTFDFTIATFPANADGNSTKGNEEKASRHTHVNEPTHASQQQFSQLV